MAKLSSVLKNEKKEYWVNKYRLKRKELRATIKNPHLTEDEREIARQKLNKLPRLSLETRVKHRCKVTGRPRGYLRKFQMSRLSFRELANRGLIPGVTKASW